ncbi:phospholipase effector Tle1 domain-containing protein [Marinimicrobium sp. C2-29]|uniref:phospholipase effector Tle1 domain-containing protein n=1 Tax=Marinimicrobium sp. C2-29 TaxID=3139825 RepID=UPI0031396DFC
MTEIGEGVFVPEPPKSSGEEGEGKKKLKVRLLLFFDGTANNRTNVEERENNTEVYRDLADQWVELKAYQSYNNAKSNIALLEEQLDPEKPPKSFDHALSVYTEGAGTEDREHDRRRGLTLGTGSTGIEEKVKKGINVAVTELDTLFQSAEEDAVLEKLAIDLFGFSRGAASARHCVHRLMDEGGEPIAEQLEVEGFPAEKIEINFVGLFETVSSHGLSFSNDVGALKLDAIRRAKRVVQLEASEEYRENFSLTTIKSAGGKGRRICLPGAHSDIGGGYRDGEEAQIVFKGAQRDRHADRDWLLGQGWYRPGELTLPTSRNTLNYVIHAKRALVKASYSKIPLGMMADFIKEEGMKMNSKEFPNIVDLREESAELRELEGRIKAYVGSVSDSRPEDWQVRDPLLYIIRHQYLHLSAHYSGVGMAPRLKSGQRRRQYHEG